MSIVFWKVQRERGGGEGGRFIYCCGGFEGAAGANALRIATRDSADVC